MNNQITLSQRAAVLTSSAIREILKVTERPEMISFAGGLPSASTFPFYATAPQTSMLRLSCVTVPACVTVSADKIDAGIKNLGELFAAVIATLPVRAAA